MSGEVHKSSSGHLRPPKPTRRTKKSVPVSTSQINRVRHPQSSKSGIILFIGEENGGKSTTLNFLFGDEEISPVAREIGTTDILEFQSTHPVTNLRLIDVPGLGSSNRPWDGQILASLKKFMDTDQDLCR